MTLEQGKELLLLARNAIAARLGMAQLDEIYETWLMQPGAVFVTLTEDGQLRGCIGSLSAWRPLLVDLRENAVAAAFRDPRFLPVTTGELATIRVEVSLLSPAQPFWCQNENDACQRLRPNLDGVILEYQHHRATFLPQVWEQLPDPRQFLAQLKRKAGLTANFWHHDLTLQTYSVQKFKE